MWKIKLFGLPEIWQNDRLITSFVSRKSKALFYYLATEREKKDRKELATFFWDDVPTYAAQNNLRTALFNLKKEVGECIETDSHWLQLSPHVDITIDTDLLRAIQPGAKLKELEQVPTFYRGKFLEKFRVEDANLFNRWVEVRRTEFEHLAVSHLLQLVERYNEQERHENSLSTTEAILKIQPLSEFATLLRMQSFIHLGMRERAVQQFQHYQSALKRENPSAQPANSLKELYQSISATRAVRTVPTLPRRLTPFYGRKNELNWLTSQILSQKYPFITISGPGGMGKTRLALEAGTRVQTAFTDGVYFASLRDINPESAEICEKDLITTLCRALRIRFDLPQNARQQLFDTLQNFQALLILDNVEKNPHVSSCLSEIVQNAPELQLLATARKRLKVEGEAFLSLSGLDFPPTEESAPPPAPDFLRTFSSLQLFEERAQRLLHTFQIDATNEHAVARICELLGGMPLGIELAAYQIIFKSPADLVTLIEKDPGNLATNQNLAPEHQNLGRLLETTWEPLPEDLQQQAVVCSFFQRGFTVDAFKNISQANESTLQYLLDLSLIQSTAPGRFTMHPVIQQFAQTKLPQEHTIYACDHARYFIGMLVNLEDSLSDNPASALELHPEKANLQFAWKNATKYANYDLLRQGAYPLASFYKRLGLIAHAQGIFQRTSLALQAAPNPPPKHAAALGAIWLELSHIEELLGNLEEAGRLPNAVLALAEPIQDAYLLAGAHLRKASAAYLKNDIATILEESQAGLEFARQISHQRLIMVGIMGQGISYLMQGENEKAIHIFEQGKELISDKPSRMMATLFQSLGKSYASIGEFSKAIDVLQRGLAIQEQFNDLPAQMLARINLGDVYMMQGQFALARQMYEHVISSKEKLGNIRHHNISLRQLSLLDFLTGDLASAYQRTLEVEDTTRTKKLDNLQNILVLKGQLLMLQGNLDQAQECIDEAEQTGDPKNQYLIAAQIDLALLQNNTTSALKLAENTLAELYNIRYDNFCDPFTIFLFIYRAFTTAQDPRAHQVLADAHQELQRLRNLAPKDEHDALLNIPARRILEEAYSKTILY